MPAQERDIQPLVSLRHASAYMKEEGTRPASAW
jgi:hypothetical protein